MKKLKHMVLRILLVFTAILSCKSNEAPLEIDLRCSPSSYKKYLSQQELIAAIDDEIITRLGSSEFPDQTGAMGNNRPAYFHVRFQMGIQRVASLALDQQRLDVLEGAVKAIEYSFAKQKPEGDFEMVIPESLRSLGTPTEGDLASATSFFMSSLGMALLAFEESTWFALQNQYKARIDNLRPNILQAFTYLRSKKDILKIVDAKAPNRLLFNAIAFYSFGKYFKDEKAMADGIEFTQLALNSQQPEGYYLEGNGWDSSYQGVALENGFHLLSILGADNIFNSTLYASLACGTAWEASRILPDGEVSTEGNSRVYPGGEAFLGKEKSVAVKSIIFAFLSMHQYAGMVEYKTLADRVIKFYD